MDRDALTRDLQDDLAALLLVDAHTHLIGGKLAARGLHDVQLYHMVVSDLYAAGCPDGRRLTQYPGWPAAEEAHARLVEALPYLPLTRNTFMSWGVRVILRDLYEWTEPVTESNWQRLDAMIRERADDRAWPREILRRAGITSAVTESARREGGVDDDVLRYSMEWAFFTRTQRGEYDTAVYELERCWDRTPDSPLPHSAAGRPAALRTIRTLDDVHAALAHYVTELAAAPIGSMATHISTEQDYRTVSDDEMAAALTRRDTAGPAERAVYASYINEAFLTVLAKVPRRIAFQFSFGAEPLPHETGSFLRQETIAQVADMIARHPGVQFICYLSSRHANQSLCTLCRELPNLALAGYWWHNFFPGAVRQVIEERLDMLPLNRQIGFFSDAYCVEWAYAKAHLVRNQFAQVLSQKVEQGQYTREEALAIARHLFAQTAADLVEMQAS